MHVSLLLHPIIHSRITQIPVACRKALRKKANIICWTAATVRRELFVFNIR